MIPMIKLNLFDKEEEEEVIDLDYTIRATG